MKRTLLLSVGIFFAIVPALFAADTESVVRDAVAPYVGAGKPMRGCVVGVVVGEEVGVFPFGKIDIDDGANFSERTPDGETLFAIASITKLFTSLILAEMSLRGEVDLDEPFAKLLPEGTVLPQFDSRNITVREIAMHRSGLTRLPPDYQSLSSITPGNPYVAFTKELTYQQLAKWKPEVGPNERYEYSNFGFALLGNALADRLGTTFTELVENRILKPLGMISTRTDRDAAVKSRLAIGFQEGVPAQHFDRSGFIPSGGIMSCCNDLNRFGMAAIGRFDLLEKDLGRTISASDREQWGRLKAAFELAMTPTGEAKNGNNIGLAWHQQPAKKFYWHTGLTGGYYTKVIVDPIKKISIIVLSNSRENAPDAISNKIYNALVATNTESLVRKAVAPHVGEGKLMRSCVVGVVAGDETSVFPFGKIETYDETNSSGRMPDGETLFEIASLSKLFTGLILAEMSLRGEVDLDEPFAKLLPEGTVLPRLDSRVMTVREVAMHRSGLTRLPPDYQSISLTTPGNPYSAFTKELTYQQLAEWKPEVGPNERYEYSNFGFALLGNAMADRLGTTFTELLEDRVLKPLGMNSTRTSLDAAAKSHFAIGYTKEGAQSKHWEMSGFIPGGGLISCCNDMNRFGMAAIGRFDLLEKCLVATVSASDREQWERLKVAFELAMKPTAEGKEGHNIGLAWNQQPTKVFYWHTGLTGGYQSRFMVDPIKKISIIVLSNGQNSASEAISNEIYNTLVAVDTESLVQKAVAPRIGAGKPMRGCVVGVVTGEEASVFPFGKIETVDGANSSGQMPDGETLFEIASVSKLFTGLILAEMSLRGEVDLDEPFAKLLPEGTVLPQFDSRVMTVREVAMHRSGLTRLPAYYQIISRTTPGNPYSAFTKELTYRLLAEWKPAVGPNERYEYSNFGFALLGNALADRLGTTFTELLEDRVLKPLGMTSTRTNLDAAAKSRFAIGYAREGVPSQHWEMSGFIPGGGLISCCNDMNRFGMAAIGRFDLLEKDLGRTVSASDREQWERLKAAFELAMKPTGEGKGGHNIGLAWNQQPAKQFYWHTGLTGGYYTMFMVDPVKKISIVALSNGRDSAPEVVSNKIYDSLRNTK